MTFVGLLSALRGWRRARTWGSPTFELKEESLQRSLRKTKAMET